MLDPWLELSGPLAEAATPIGQQVLEAFGPEGKRPRADLVHGVGAIVPAIIANLMVLHRDRPEGERLIDEMIAARGPDTTGPAFARSLRW